MLSQHPELTNSTEFCHKIQFRLIEHQSYAAVFSASRRLTSLVSKCWADLRTSFTWDWCLKSKIGLGGDRVKKLNKLRYLLIELKLFQLELNSMNSRSLSSSIRKNAGVIMLFDIYKPVDDPVVQPVETIRFAITHRQWECFTLLGCFSINCRETLTA